MPTILSATLDGSDTDIGVFSIEEDGIVVSDSAESGVYEITYYTRWYSDQSIDPDDYPEKTFTLGFSDNPCTAGFNAEDLTAEIMLG